MSAVTDQKHCEDIMLAILALQTDLAGVNMVHFDNSAQASATSMNRIVVQGMTREVELYGINESTPLLFSVMVKVTAKLAANDPALLDTYVAAIQAANAAGAAPAGIITLATSLFGARGFQMFNTDEGERTDTPNERSASQVWKCVFGA